MVADLTDCGIFYFILFFYNINLFEASQMVASKSFYHPLLLHNDSVPDRHAGENSDNGHRMLAVGALILLIIQGG